MLSCSLHKTTWNFIEYSKQLDLTAQENSIFSYAWNKIYVVLRQTPLQVVMYSNNLLRNYTMYYALNIYYAIFMIYSCTYCGSTVQRLGGIFSIQRGFFLWVVAFIMLCFRGSSIIMHTEKSITLLFVLLQIQFKVYRSGKI